MQIKKALLPMIGTITIMMMLSSGCENARKGEASLSRIKPDSKIAQFAASLQDADPEDRDALVLEFISENPVTPIIESDTIASIYYYGKADQVFINGDLQNGWSEPEELDAVNCSEATFFCISMVLPVDARVDYEFIIDSLISNDPRNPKITPSGFGPHSEIAMPGFHPDPARASYANVPKGSIDSIFFTSKNAKILPRMIRIYRPKGFEQRSNMPVLYVVDGIEALVFMDYSNILDNLIYRKKIDPTIVVFIPPGDRYEEFMYGTMHDFQEVICQEIIPLIDHSYQTDSESSRRGITGISAGGYFALMTLFNNSEYFACAAGQSPSIDTHLLLALKKFVSNGLYNPSFRIYFDMGQFDLPEGVLGLTSFIEKGEELHLEMDKLGVGHKFNVVNDGHEWASWRERTGEILVFFFGK